MRQIACHCTTRRILRLPTESWHRRDEDTLFRQDCVHWNMSHVHQDKHIVQSRYVAHKMLQQSQEHEATRPNTSAIKGKKQVSANVCICAASLTTSITLGHTCLYLAAKHAKE